MKVGLVLARYAQITGILLIAVFLAVVYFASGGHRIIGLAAFDVALLMAIVWAFGATLVVLTLRNSTPKGLLVLLFLFIAVPAALWILGLRWDLLVRFPARISVDGQPYHKGRVYRGWGGETAVFLDESSALQVYVPKLHDVIVCDATLFHDYRLFGRLEKGRDEYLCMSSEKEEVNIKLLVTPESVSFDRYGGTAIQRVTVYR